MYVIRNLLPMCFLVSSLLVVLCIDSSNQAKKTKQNINTRRKYAIWKLGKPRSVNKSSHHRVLSP